MSYLTPLLCPVCDCLYREKLKDAEEVGRLIFAHPYQLKWCIRLPDGESFTVDLNRYEFLFPQDDGFSYP